MAKIFPEMDIQQPVHRLYGPFHTGMVQQLFGTQLPAGYIIMSLLCLSFFAFNLCVHCPDTAQSGPLCPSIQPADLRCGVCCPLFDSLPVLLNFGYPFHPCTQPFILHVILDVFFQISLITLF